MATVAFTRKQRFLLAVIPALATVLLRALCCTLRFETAKDYDARPADEYTGADLYAFWHRCLLLAAYRYRNRGIHILISQSFDGELIARTVQRLGFIPVRGSSSRGGAGGLIALTKALRSGAKVAITADGPRGPMYFAKPGTVALASHTASCVMAEKPLREAREPLWMPERVDGSISPFYLHPERAWQPRSWDRFLIPKPFSKVRCAWPTPVLVCRDEPLPMANERLQAALEHAVSLAENL